MRKYVEGSTCLECGVLFCDRVRNKRQRQFCSKSCSSKHKWANYRSDMLKAIRSKKSPIFKDGLIECEFCGGKEIRDLRDTAGVINVYDQNLLNLTEVY